MTGCDMNRNDGRAKSSEIIQNSVHLFSFHTDEV